jgi:hypothetical protein
MERNERLASIMARVDAWAQEGAGWDCRDDAEHEVRFLLEEEAYSDWNDDMIFEAGVLAWQEAE